MRPCRDFTPEGMTRKQEKRATWRARRWAIRLAGQTSRSLLDLFVLRRHPVKVYRTLARKPWRAST